MPQHRLGVMAAALAAVLRSATAPPVRLIIDTDIGGGGCNDVDDVVAICIGHAMEQRGELELLAIVQDTAPPQCAGAISVLNTWYGSHAPIGAYDIRTPGATLELEEPLSYVPELTAHWPSPVKNTSQGEDTKNSHDTHDTLIPRDCLKIACGASCGWRGALPQNAGGAARSVRENLQHRHINQPGGAAEVQAGCSQPALGVGASEAKGRAPGNHGRAVRRTGRQPQQWSLLQHLRWRVQYEQPTNGVGRLGVRRSALAGRVQDYLARGGGWVGGAEWRA